MIDYTNLQQSLDRAVERAGTAFANSDPIQDTLEHSAGLLGVVVYYRPYYAAAKFIEQNKLEQALSKAEDGVTFTGYERVIQSLFDQQRALDLALGLEIPPGFEVPPPCGGGGTLSKSVVLKTVY